MIIKFSPKKVPKFDERGFILVITMVLAMVALALSGAMLFMATIGTKIAGGYQRYTSTISAARGASDVAMSLLKNSMSSTTPDYGTVSTTYPSCLATKLNTATCLSAPATGTQCVGGSGTTYYQWGGTCDTYANATSTNAAVDPDVTTTYNDARTNSPAYTVYTKIINTQAIIGAVTAPGACNCNACTYCYVYTVLVLSKNINTPENSIVTFTYMVYDGNNID
ncbi:hypothetical protein [Candidatus Magnetominusculus dajiuhuensis]|uniref:hypothetical protein n=1 Tax=Candidatus Magnetominusculus dajiuhuensis TaxID=3137712 RepID=UPI001A04BBB3|nr:hypothetical protein [Nitrospirota bacterium]